MAAPLNSNTNSSFKRVIPEDADSPPPSTASSRKRKYTALSPEPSGLSSSTSSSSSSSAVIQIDPAWVEAASAASSVAEQDVEKQRLLRRKAAKVDETPVASSQDSPQSVGKIFEKFVAALSQLPDSEVEYGKRVEADREFAGGLLSHFSEEIPSSIKDALAPLLGGSQWGGYTKEIRKLLRHLAHNSLLSQECCDDILETSLENLKMHRGSEFSDQWVFDLAIEMCLEAKEIEIADSMYQKIFEEYESRETVFVITQEADPLPDCWISLMNRLAEEGASSQTRTEEEKEILRARAERALSLFFGFRHRAADTLLKFLEKLGTLVSSECLNKCLLKMVNRFSSEDYYGFDDYRFNKNFYGGVIDVFLGDSLFSSFSQETLKKALVEGAARLQPGLVKRILEKGKDKISGEVIGKAIASIGARFLEVPKCRLFLANWAVGASEKCKEAAEEFESIGDALFRATEQRPNQEIPENFLKEALLAHTEKDAWLHHVMGKQVVRIIKYCNENGLNHIWLALPPEKRGRALRMVVMKDWNLGLLGVFVQHELWLKEIPLRFFTDYPSVCRKLKKAGWKDAPELRARPGTPGVLDPEEVETSDSEEESGSEEEVV